MKIFLLAGSLGWLCGEGPFELELACTLLELCGIPWVRKGREKPKHRKVNKIRKCFGG